MGRTYMVSELIARLQGVVSEHGDLPVYANDPETDWRLPIGVVYREEDKGQGYPERVEIKTEYFGPPEGGFE